MMARLACEIAEQVEEGLAEGAEPLPERMLPVICGD